MNSKIFGAKAHQLFKSLHKLFFRKPVFGISRVVHDVGAQLKDSAGIETAADGLRNARTLRQIVDMCIIIQINVGAEGSSFLVLFHRCHIG